MPTVKLVDENDPNPIVQEVSEQMANVLFAR